MTDRKFDRLSVNMRADTAQQLREIAEMRGLNVTDSVREAIAIAHIVIEAHQRRATVHIRERGGSWRNLELGPDNEEASSSTPDVGAVVKYWSARRGESETETIRRSIAVYDFVMKEVEAGNKLALIEKDGKLLREVDVL